jgi:uncharacterized protein (TIGR02271 family)
MQTRTNAIQQGWDVYGSDDQKIGSVDQVASNYLVIQKGWFFTTDVYVPSSAIESVDPGEGRVYLNVAKNDVDAQGWTNPPEEGQYESDQSQEWEGWAARGDRQTTDRESGTMALHAEELEAQKTTEEVGSVNLRKDVVEEQKSIDVPVTREEVQVRRTAVDRPADTSTAFQSDQIDVPVRADRVEVTKTPHVVEEVEVSKTPVEETKTVSDTVRRERVDVGTTGAAELEQSTTGGGRSRTLNDDQV